MKREFIVPIDYIGDIPPDNEEIVRCKDCRFGWDTKNNKYPSLPGIVCNAYESEAKLHGYDWFCADGKRKSD